MAFNWSVTAKICCSISCFCSNYLYYFIYKKSILKFKFNNCIFVNSYNLGFINLKDPSFLFFPTQTIDTPYTYFVGKDEKELEHIRIK